MKICIFTETYYPVVGGGETQAKLLAEGLIEAGHSVTILTRRSDASLKRYEKYGDIQVVRLPPVGSGQMKKWGLLLTSFPMLVKLRREYDLVFVSGYRIIGVAAIVAGKVFRKRIVLKADSQGEMSGEFFESGLQKFGVSRGHFLFRRLLGLRNFVLRKADASVAISSDIQAELISNGIPENTIHRIPNCVDTRRFSPVDPAKKILLREKLNLPNTAAIVTYTGRLVSYKGLPLLVKVWKEIRSHHENAFLVLVGSGGLDIHNCEAELHQMVKSAALENSVRFTGAVPNVPEYLQASDIFAFPTENDAFPSSVIEAMACGLPVVSTPVGAIKSVLIDQKNGLVIEPGDYQQLYQALETLLCNPELASRLGRYAIQTVEEQFSSVIVTRKYIDLFQDTI